MIKMHFLAASFLLCLTSTCLVKGEDEPSAPASLPSNIEVFTVQTTSPENREVPFYLRKPAGYDSSQPGPFRVLLMCPFYGHDGLDVITGGEANHNILDAADEKKWFILSPSFKQTASETHDPQTSYYYPQKFSGQAVLDALDQVSQKYPVDIYHILVQGLSGGGQFSHRFAFFAPDRVVAAAINSSSWFDAPTPACNQTAWLVTIGDSDPSVNNTIKFVGQLQDAGATPLFRSYMGMVHEGDERVTALDVQFLEFYDDLTKGQLGTAKDYFQASPPLAMQGKEMPFVGNNETWEYVPNNEVNRTRIGEDFCVYLPSKTIADNWGTLKQSK